LSLLPGISVGLRCGLDSCRGSGCRVSCSLGLGFGCYCGWPYSGSPSCIAPACYKASRPPPSLLAVSYSPFYLDSWARAASGNLAMASSFVVMSVMPIPYNTLSLWHSSHFVSPSYTHSLQLSLCAYSHATCASGILGILSIVWCS
jgi:hypothetical protein